MELNRIRCQNDNWCSFMGVDLEHEHFNDMEGLYIIWSKSQGVPVPLRVGQGNIKDRLTKHRDDPEIIQYIGSEGSYVTWAKVSSLNRDGIERYLADILGPLVGERFPDRQAISVNLPR